MCPCIFPKRTLAHMHISAIYMTRIAPRNGALLHVRKAKTQFSMGTSQPHNFVSSIDPSRVNMYIPIVDADREDANQTAQMCRLTRVFAVRTHNTSVNSVILINSVNIGEDARFTFRPIELLSLHIASGKHN